MEEETGLQGGTGMRDPADAIANEDPPPAEGHRGPTWRGWVLSILVAVILSVTATLLLGGSGAFRTDPAVAAGAGGYGAGRSCCPPADIGK
jgi:hypothetical protein